MLKRKSCTCCLLISQVTLYVSEDTKKLLPSTLVSRSVCSSLIQNKLHACIYAIHSFLNYGQMEKKCAQCSPRHIEIYAKLQTFTPKGSHTQAISADYLLQGLNCTQMASIFTTAYASPHKHALKHCLKIIIMHVLHVGSAHVDHCCREKDVIL